MNSRLLSSQILAFVLASITLLFAELVQATSKFDASFLHSINSADTINISPKDSTQKYYLYVKLPPSPKPNKKYPVVYLLDGGATFPMLTPIYGQLHFLEDVPDVILVGISYGSANWRKGNNRSHDYTVSSKLKEHWGGASKFSDFLRTELFPMIETKYPADPQRRILFGNSLAGQFGLYTATYQTDLVYAIIANNPAIHEVTDQFLVKSVKKAAPYKLKLFVALAEHDAEMFKKPMQKWLTHWADNPPSQWQLKVKAMTGHNHFSSIPNAFREGLKWVLEN